MYNLKKVVFMIKVTLTVEEWQRLAAVTREEREKALRQLRRWVTWQIIKRGFNVEVGPFSRGAMGGNADDIICEECEEALFCGEVHWKPTRSLSSMLIQVAKSKMGHIIEDYYEHGKPEYTLLSEYDEDREAIEKGIAAQWKWEAEICEKGYKIAHDAVAGHPELQAYLNAMYQEDTYLGIAIALGTDIETVFDLEKKLLNLLKKKITK